MQPYKDQHIKIQKSFRQKKINKTLDLLRLTKCKRIHKRKLIYEINT